MRARRMVLAVGCVTMSMGAQTVISGGELKNHRESLMYQGGKLMVQEVGAGFGEKTALSRYAAKHADLHGGNFVLFVGEDGAIHDLTDAKAMEQLQTTYAPMLPLAEQQTALAAPQSALGGEQAALASQMHAATPTQMGTIGHEQGTLGHVQGRIGKTQGAIGRQQGAISREYRAELAEAINHCLNAGTCPAIVPAVSN